MDAINNKSVNEASLRQAQIKLGNLERVLDRFETEDFGILIRPESLLCVNCAR